MSIYRGRRKRKCKTLNYIETQLRRPFAQRSMTIPELFKDLVDEILWRVPATSLKRLRPTCKRWNRLFKDDGRFAREHSEKAAKEFLFLMVTENYRIQQMSVNLHGEVPSVELRRELSLPDPDFNNKRQFDISEAFHCDGLLLCTHNGTRKYGSKIVVWNPFTGQTRWIETGNRCKTAKSFFLGYCYQDKKKNKSCSKSYKILCFGMFGEDTEIYELNSDSWRRIPDISPCWSIGCSEHSVSLKGNTYWFGKEKSKEHLGMSLLRFDFTTEKASICVPLPYQCPWYKIMSLSVVRGEKLSVFLQPEKSCKAEIWVTNKIDDTTLVVSWSKVLALYLSPLLQIIPDLYITDNILFWLDEEKKVALCFQRDTDMEDEDRAFDKIFILEEDNKVTEVGYGANTTPPSAGCWPAILSYVPSLVQIEREGGKTLNYIESQLRRPFAQRSMTIPELFKDLVDEILCRVPATSLKRLRPTCKRWNRLFKDDGRFAREHSEKAAKEFLFLRVTENYRIQQMSVNLHGEVPSVELRRELSLPDPDFNNKRQFDISEAFHCDGLLVCTHGGTRKYGSKIVVWNPFTGQTRWIETGNRCKTANSFFLGYCYQDKKKNKSCSKSYKILCFGMFGEDTEIYELNSDSWRRIPDISPCWSIGYIGYSEHSVSLKGNTYWFGKEKSKEHLGMSLLRFDFTTEKASICVPLPYQCPWYKIMSLSVVRGEKLSVFLQPEKSCKAEIWVTNKIDDTTLVVSWSKVLALYLSPLLQIIPDLYITDNILFWLDEEKKVALCFQRDTDMEDEDRAFDKIFILEEDNKVTEVGYGANTTPPSAGCWPAILSYVPSLVQIEREGGKRKRGD